MAKLVGNGTNDYTKAMLGDDPNLVNSDDDEDITASVLGGKDDDVTPVKGRSNNRRLSAQQNAEEEEEVEEEEEEVETDDYQEPVEKEHVYKKDQVQKIVQTRVGTFQRKLEKLTPYKEAFDRMSEITGMDVNALVARLNTMSIEEQAAILGMKPEEVKAARQARTDIMQERGKNQTLTRQLEETQLKTDKRFSDFDLYKDEIDELIADNPKLTLKQAYTLARGDTASEAAVRDAEQRVINKQVINKQKGVVRSAGAGQQNQGPRVDNATIAAAKKVGMDPLEYARYGEIDNIDAYRAHKAKQNQKR